MSEDRPVITKLNFDEFTQDMAELKKIVETIKTYSENLEASSMIISNGKPE